MSYDYEVYEETRVTRLRRRVKFQWVVERSSEDRSVLGVRFLRRVFETKFGAAEWVTKDRARQHKRARRRWRRL